MSGEKCGSPVGVVLVSPEVVEKETIHFNDPERSDLVLSERATILLRRIRLKEPDWSPDTVKGLWNKAWRMGILDEQE